jgi:hypothetical protein
VLKVLIIFVVLAIYVPASLCQSRQVMSGRNVAPSTTSPVNPFSPGERLSYDVSWADFIVAAELNIDTDDRRSFDGIEGYHVTVQARTVGLVSGLALKVNDVYESFIDRSTLKPFRAEKRSRHGKKETQSSITIEKNTAKLGAGRTLELPDDTYDLAGLLFAIRGMDLTIGKSRTFTLIEDDKLYTIKVQPEGREKVSIPTGTYETVKVATSMVKGRENDKLYNLRIFITSDARRLPVLITAEPSWGSVRVELTSVAGGTKPSKTNLSSTADR